MGTDRLFKKAALCKLSPFDGGCVAALLALMMVGCSEPGRMVEGTFFVHGKPKPGVEVRLSHDLSDYSRCDDGPSAVTDRSGRFAVSTAEFPMRPCFIVDGVVHSDSMIVDNGNKAALRFRCALPLNVTGHFEDGHLCY
jgi:hypothetical protein